MCDSLTRRLRAGGLLLAVVVLAAPAAALAQAPAQQAPVVPGGTSGVPENSITKVSDHVSAIVGNPNIAFVIGDRATLVVDTGLGAKSGAIVVKEALKVSKSPKLLLTTTHYHPEHATGASSFPDTTVFLIPNVQQQEMNKHGQEFVDFFRGNSANNRELLKDVTFRAPDVLFDREITLDLGGVHARIFWLGPAHTQGDTLIFVQEDAVLISGDIVQNKMTPSLFNEDASAKSWLEILDKLATLNPKQIVPDHGKLGDGSLIAGEKAFLQDLVNQVLALKKGGKSIEDASKQLVADFKAKYPDWTGLDGGIPRGVKRIYAEYQ
jgi:glyoxylase-like metal-dependent hydrolase (beta-lactamase superfamily II)